MEIAVCLVGESIELGSEGGVDAMCRMWEECLPKGNSYVFFSPYYIYGIRCKLVNIPYSNDALEMSSKASQALRIYEYQNNMVFDVCIKLPFKHLIFENNWFVPPRRDDEVHCIPLGEQFCDSGARSFKHLSFELFYARSSAFKTLMEMQSFNVTKPVGNIINKFLKDVDCPEDYHYYEFIKRMGFHYVPNRDIAICKE